MELSAEFTKAFIGKKFDWCWIRLRDRSFEILSTSSLFTFGSETGEFCAIKEVAYVEDDVKSKESAKQLEQVLLNTRGVLTVCKDWEYWFVNIIGSAY